MSDQLWAQQRVAEMLRRVRAMAAKQWVLEANERLKLAQEMRK